ncbi:hypothetical protein NKH36_17040 [Mesorhizobium sp. M1312]|uniref:hypothetical protein n=1 Tax=unclassified Mesorhizobium TaxID=325217 RepID=UPI003338687B
MIAARMRECLRLLRWSETDFAEEAGYPVAKAKAWLYGREHPPRNGLAGDAGQGAPAAATAEHAAAAGRVAFADRRCHPAGRS